MSEPKNKRSPLPAQARLALVMTLMMPLIQMMVYGWMDTNVHRQLPDPGLRLMVADPG